MRGAVSLAAALAIPLETDAGEPIRERPLILFVTFCVILATLVLQGLTLPVLILHGTADKVTNPSGSRYFFEHAGSPPLHASIQSR